MSVNVRVSHDGISRHVKFRAVMKGQKLLGIAPPNLPMYFGPGEWHLRYPMWLSKIPNRKRKKHRHR